ncbi:MAG: hypothetical protein KAV80_03930 [Methanomicrobia archaeon]|nr:hypothetical protein [Methanomicrobia archaeon]
MGRESDIAICDVSVFVSKSKYSSIKKTVMNLGIKEVVMPEELINILLKVYKNEALSGEEVRVLSYWSKGPIAKDSEIRDFFQELMDLNIKIRTVAEYTLKKEVELGYKKLEEGEEHEELIIYDRVWKTLFNRVSEFLPQKAAVIVSKIIAISMVFNVKILAFNRNLLRFVREAELKISKIDTSILIKGKRFSHSIVFLRGFEVSKYKKIFDEVTSALKETISSTIDIEENVGSAVILFGE